MSSFKVGPYTVRQRQEPGQQCPLYCVFLNDVLIGKSISVPDEDACRWLERQQREQTFYAYSSAALPVTSPAARRPLPPRSRGRPRHRETIEDIEKALAGD